MRDLTEEKKVIKDNFNSGSLGIFNSRNIAGDMLVPIYEGNGVRIEICPYYEYFEVFGLTCEEFEKVKEYYDHLGEHKKY